MKFTDKILHIISIIFSYLFTFSLLFTLQKHTIGLLIKDVIIFNNISLYKLIFTFTSILLINKYVKISSPYKKKLKKC